MAPKGFIAEAERITVAAGQGARGRCSRSFYQTRKIRCSTSSAEGSHGHGGTEKNGETEDCGEVLRFLRSTPLLRVTVVVVSVQPGPVLRRQPPRHLGRSLSADGVMQTSSSAGSPTSHHGPLRMPLTR